MSDSIKNSRWPQFIKEVLAPLAGVGGIMFMVIFGEGERPSLIIACLTLVGIRWSSKLDEVLKK